MRSFNIVPQANSSSGSIVAISWPTHQLWKSKSEIRLPTFGCYGLDAHRHTNSTAHHAYCQPFKLGHIHHNVLHLNCSFYHQTLKHSYITEAYACHDWNGWDFYPAVIPSSKLSPLVLISWIGKRGYINIFPQKKKKKDLETVHVASCIILCSLSIKRRCFCIQVSVYE